MSADINSFNNSPELNVEPERNKTKMNGRKRKIIISSVIVLFLVTGLAGLGFAKGFYDNHRGGHGPMGFIMEKIVKDLDLNEQQKAEVEKIKDEIKAKMDAKKEDRKNDAEEMEKMFRQNTFDKQKALEFAKKHDAERDEMKSFMIDELAKFHSILTSDQRNKAADKMKEFREKKHEMKDKWNKEDKK
ncbi:MAG: Spy/CpxP family protein refolding chaperone [Ignavibacteria bacterium]